MVLAQAAMYLKAPLATLPTSLASSPVQRVQRILLALVSAVLLLDAGVLMALRHFNVGVVVPAVLGTAGALLAWQWPLVQRWRRSKRSHARLWNWGWALLALWVLSVLLFWGRLLGTGVQPEQVPPVAAIVVLGSGTQNGQPRPVLAERLDTAAQLAHLQPSALIAVCGGVDWGETESEATVMARYLMERHGIPAERLVLEGESTSTELNLQLSRPLLQARGVDATAPMAMVSSDFHLMRAMAMAQQQGLTDVVPVAAATPLATRYNAWLREYFAMLSSWALGEL